MARDDDKGFIPRNIGSLLVALAAVAAVVVIAALPARQQRPEPTEAPPVNVVAEKIEPVLNLADSFDLPAVVEPNRVVTICAEIAGRVVGLGAGKGARLQEGQLLVQLDDDLLRPQLDSAVAQVQRDQLEFERMRELFSHDATSKRDLDDATTRLAVSKAALAEIQARLERTRIVCPVDGVLNGLVVEVGEYVQPGMTVAEVVEMDPVKVVVDVPERDTGFFVEGQSAKVLLGGPGPALSGIIGFVSRTAHPQTRCTRMEVIVPNQDNLLRGGQIVSVRLTRRVFEKAIVVPLSSVIPMEDSKAVYVVDGNGLAQRRQVTLGMFLADRVQILDGLREGDLLVTSGHRFLSPGQKVRIVRGGN